MEEANPSTANTVQSSHIHQASTRGGGLKPPQLSSLHIHNHPTPNPTHPSKSLHINQVNTFITSNSSKTTVIHLLPTNISSQDK